MEERSQASVPIEERDPGAVVAPGLDEQFTGSLQQAGAVLLLGDKLVDGADRVKNVLIYRELKEVKNKWEERILSKFENKIVDPADIAKEFNKFYENRINLWDFLKEIVNSNDTIRERSIIIKDIYKHILEIKDEYTKNEFILRFREKIGRCPRIRQRKQKPQKETNEIEEEILYLYDSCYKN